MALGWAILGTGRHVQRYVAPAIRAAEEARLVAVLSRDRARADAFASDEGAARGYDNLDELLADPEVQAVFVATPNHLHAGQTIRAAAAGKHVLCEKPMALTAEDAHRVIDTCRQHGVKLGVGFHLRHHAANLAARRLLAAGEVGRVVLCRAQWSYGGPPRGGWWAEPEQTGFGSLAAVGVHIVDLLRFLLDQEITEVSAFSVQAEGASGLDETVAATLRFGGGSLGLLACSRQTPKGDNDFSVFGSEGRLDGVGVVGQAPAGRLVLSNVAGVREIPFSGPDPYTAEIEAFQRAVLEDREPEASGLDGLRSVEVLDAIVRSNRDRRAISLAGGNQHIRVH